MLLFEKANLEYVVEVGYVGGRVERRRRERGFGCGEREGGRKGEGNHSKH